MRLIFLVVAVSGCGGWSVPPVVAPDVKRGESTYEYKLISSDDNFPAVDLHHDSLGVLEVALHRGLSASEIAREFAWPDSTVLSRLRVLRGADLATLDSDGLWHAGVMVITLDDTARGLRADRDIVRRGEAAILRKLPAIKVAVDSIAGFKGLSFAEVSYLVLSDVLLDNWQIDTVERRFLGVERPLRKGKRFYFSIQEKPSTQDAEAFGIFGNAYRSLRAEPYTIAVYGNHRNGGTLLTLLRGDSSLSSAARSIAMHQPATTGLSQPDIALFTRAGLAKGDRLAVPVLDSLDDAGLARVAGGFSNELVQLLNDAKPSMRRAYEHSAYVDEVSFAEYAIWWYHLYYSAVTHALIRRGVIVVPETGNTTYMLRR